MRVMLIDRWLAVGDPCRLALAERGRVVLLVLSARLFYGVLGASAGMSS